MATKNPYAQFGPSVSQPQGTSGPLGPAGGHSADPRRLDSGWTGGKQVDLPPAGYGGGGGGVGVGGESGGSGWGGSRTSVLAILSLVSAVLCFLPGTGALAMLLGGAALISIRMSAGRKGGTGLAVGGIALGLIVTVLWSACVFGGTLFLREVGGLTDVLPAAQAHNTDAVRAKLAPGVTVTEEEVRAFGDALTAAHGGYVKAPRGVLAYLLGMSRAPQAMSLAAEGQRIYGAGSQVMVMPVEFDRATVGVVVVVSSGPPVKMFNIGFEERSVPGGVVWMLPTPGSTPRAPQPPVP